MAEVSFLHFPEEDHDSFLDDFSTFDSFPFFPHRHATFDGGATNPSTRTEDRKNQVSFVIDLLHQQVERSNIMSETFNDFNFGEIEGDYHVGVERSNLVSETFNDTNIIDNNNDNLLDLELRLGLGLVEDDEIGVIDDCNCGGFVVSDCGDEFYVARRENIMNEEIPSGSSRVGGIMVVGIDSDSEEEENEMWRVHVHSEEDDFEVDNVNDGSSIPLRWDSFNLYEEEEEEDRGGVNVDFEWEEVDDRVVDEREVLSVVVDPDDEEFGLETNSVWAYSGPEEEERGRGNLEWEVLLDVNNLGRNSDMMGIDNDNDTDAVAAYFGDNDNDDIFNAAEYELMFGQFAESENACLSRPPASKVVVEKLPSVVTTEEDVKNEKALCAVCKDMIEVGEEGKQLPCSHRYHGDCILPWLGIRNTCPLCRYELPTDDPDYELRRVRRANRVE